MRTASDEVRIGARILHLIEALMRGQGLDYRGAVRAVGIDPAVTRDREARVSMQRVAQLLENVARETGNDAFGAQLGETFRIGVAGALDYVISNAPTLRDAFNDYMRFLGLVTDGFDDRFVERARFSYFVAHLPASFGPRTQLLDARASARLIRIRHMLRDPSVPIVVEFERQEPKRIAEFRRIFGPRVRFGQRQNRVGIPTAVLDRKLPAADPILYEVVVEAAERALAQATHTPDTTSRVITFIGAALPRGRVDLAAAAKELGVSPQSLKNLLRHAGTNFRDVLDDTRKTMTEHYIKETSLPMTEIAFLLGFSELSAFSRVTRKWFGQTPRALRKRGSRA
jgi:AraC-like DNA-binding protein